MSREEVTAFLRSVQLSLDTLQRQLDSGVSELPNVSREALPLFLHQQKLALTQAFAGQLEEWQSFEEDTGLGEAMEASAGSREETAAAAEEAAEEPPFHVRLRSLEQRVASMGGRPALGACVLPKYMPGQRAQLHATSSAAAVEILRGRMDGAEAVPAPLRKTGSNDAEQAVRTPMVQLRKVEAPVSSSSSKGGPGTPGVAAMKGELAAVLQRRVAQRQQEEVAAASAP